MRLTRTCPRCGAQIEPSHSPDSKECSDNCITRHQARVASLEAALRALRRTRHYTCDDEWYSCPKSEFYTGNSQHDGCNCGMDKINTVIDAALAAGGTDAK